MRKWIIALLASPIVIAALTAQGNEVPYPQGYRDWRHIKSMVISKGHPLFESFGGIHHLYANELALKGYAAGKFADGSIIVFDLLETVTTRDAATTEGPRKVLAVMHKDASRWAATGGWGFEAFKGDSQTERVVRGDAVKACFTCHTAQKAQDYVFSRAR